VNEDARSLDRDRVVEALVEHYAQDRIPMEEFERRVERAHRSRTREELRDLLSDLPDPTGAGTALTAPAAEPGTAAVAATGSGVGLVPMNPDPPPERQTEVAIWSGRVRKGPWRPARSIRAVACMGGVELDFREALFPPGETRIHAAAVMGAVEILVPPGVRVETDGFAFMGGFEEETGGPGVPPPAPGAPVLRVSGFAFMGAVEVSSRLPGESVRDARRRKKEAQRRISSGEGQ
jgi:hypothetical protein